MSRENSRCLAAWVVAFFVLGVVIIVVVTRCCA
jgi:hypothetical protein